MSKSFKNGRTYKKVSGAFLIAFMIVAVILAFLAFDAGILSSHESLQSFIDSCGIFAPLVFCVFMVISVIILIIPCSWGYAVGTVLFGPLLSTVLNCISSFLGSFFIFVIVRKWGAPVLEALVPEKMLNKYYGLLQNQRGFEKFFAIMLLVPFTPDNALCYIAGCTKMSLKRFSSIILLFKLWKVIAFCYGIDIIYERLMGFVSVFA